MAESICERIKQAMELRNMKQIDIVEKTGIDKGQLSSYLSGKYKPKQDNINLIAKALNVNEAWLMGYNVPMGRKVYSKAEERPTNISNDLNNFLSHMEHYYNTLNEYGRAEIIRRAKELEIMPQYNDNVRKKYSKD